MHLFYLKVMENCHWFTVIILVTFNSLFERCSEATKERLWIFIQLGESEALPSPYKLAHLDENKNGMGYASKNKIGSRSSSYLYLCLFISSCHLSFKVGNSGFYTSPYLIGEKQTVIIICLHFFSFLNLLLGEFYVSWRLYLKWNYRK